MRIVWPTLLMTLPFTVVLPPVKVTLPALVRPVPPVRKVPQPLIWPALVSARLLLSKVPPVRLMSPEFVARPLLTTSLLPSPAASVPPAALVSVPPITRLPPSGSMTPVELVIEAPTPPRPWIVPTFVMAPPVRLEVMPLSSTTPPLVQALAMLSVPAPGVTMPALLKLLWMLPGPCTTPVSAFARMPPLRTVAPLT